MVVAGRGYGNAWGCGRGGGGGSERSRIVGPIQAARMYISSLSVATGREQLGMRLMYWFFCGTEPSEGQVSSGAHVTPMCGTGPSEFIGSGIHVTQPQMPLNPRAGREQLPHSESRDPSMECSAPNPSLPHLLVPVSAVLWLPEHGKYASQVVATPGLEGWLGLGQSSSPPGGEGAEGRGKGQVVWERPAVAWVGG